VRQQVRQKIEPGSEGRMKPRATPLTFGVRPSSNGPNPSK